MKILGIDPGVKGGLCFFDVDKGEFQLYPMPLIQVPTKTKIKVSKLTKKQKQHRKETGEDFYKTEAEIHTNYIANLMRIEQPTLTILEKAFYPLGQNNYKTAERYGELRALIKQHWLTKDYAVIRPQTWKAHFGIGSDKNEAIALAEKLNSTIDLRPTPKSKPSDGLAEAFLMAIYGKENYNQLTIF
jgi:hypothetical protein